MRQDDLDNLFAIPTFLLRERREGVRVRRAPKRKIKLTVPKGRTTRKRKAPDMMIALRALGYTKGAMRRLSRRDAEWIINKHTRAPGKDKR